MPDTDRGWPWTCPTHPDVTCHGWDAYERHVVAEHDGAPVQSEEQAHG